MNDDEHEVVEPEQLECSLRVLSAEMAALLAELVTLLTRLETRSRMH